MRRAPAPAPARPGAAAEANPTVGKVTQEGSQLGRRGEDLAAAWYAARGYDVVARNWRCPEGELDLVCRHGADVVFCEVKTRSSGAFGPPQSAVTPAKRRRIRRLAARWLRVTGTHCSMVRFDVAAVRGDQVEVLEDAW